MVAMEKGRIRIVFMIGCTENDGLELAHIKLLLIKFRDLIDRFLIKLFMFGMM